MTFLVRFTNSLGEALLLTNVGGSPDLDIYEISGTDLAPATHHVVTSPVRDGERYISTLMDPRFVNVGCWLDASSFAAISVQRRAIYRILHPKLGLGVLEYQANAALDLYRIDAIMERSSFARVLATEQAAVETVQLQFRCPDPFWRKTPAVDTIIAISGSGIEFPLEFPLEFGASTAASIITNGGDELSYPTITVSGPVTSPSVTNLTTGETLSLSGLAVAGGETLVIDMLNATVEVDGANVSAYLGNDSAFWALARGDNNVEVATVGDDASFLVTHYDLAAGI